jgi:hypothetical protein
MIKSPIAKETSSGSKAAWNSVLAEHYAKSGDREVRTKTPPSQIGPGAWISALIE